MAVIVADASVVVKWLLPEREEEADVDRALLLLRQVQSGQVRLLQPSHWLLEAVAVVARLSPATAERKAAALHAMDVPVLSTQSVLLAACRLAVEMDHHLFDTLYHAVALESAGAVLVTADRRFFKKARGRGRIVLLEEYGVES